MIYHWCPARAWEASKEMYAPESLASEGFVHFSFRDQVARTATALDRGKDGMVLVCVDETRLEVVVEDSYGVGEDFPHVYGPIPLDAVVRVVEFPVSPDGTFSLPPSLGST